MYTAAPWGLGLDAPSHCSGPPSLMGPTNGRRRNFRFLPSLQCPLLQSPFLHTSLSFNPSLSCLSGCLTTSSLSLFAWTPFLLQGLVRIEPRSLPATLCWLPWGWGVGEAGPQLGGRAIFSVGGIRVRMSNQFKQWREESVAFRKLLCDSGGQLLPQALPATVAPATFTPHLFLCRSVRQNSVCPGHLSNRTTLTLDMGALGHAGSPNPEARILGLHSSVPTQLYQALCGVQTERLYTLVP